MPRITLVMSTRQPGGAERVMSNMANFWASRGWLVHLITLDHPEKPLFYPLHPAIIFEGLNLSQTLGSPCLAGFRLLRRLRELRIAIQRTSPDIVLSFNDLTNIITLFSTWRLGLPVIVGERNDPHFHPLKNPWRLFRPWAYHHASRVVAQTKHALDYFSPGIRSRGCVIPNPVLAPKLGGSHPALEHKRYQNKVVLAMGRLAKAKGFDNLIHGFAKLAPRHGDWSLAIWGEGRERCALEKMVDDLGLSSRITLPGTTKNPAEQMRNADLFVLSSLYEGFPNVLGEAMACGLPVVSFNCPSGPSELIRNGIDGILVPPGNVEALVVEMDRLMASESERRRLMGRAPEVVYRFGIEKIMGQWNNLITHLIECGSIGSPTIASSGLIRGCL